MNSSPTPCATPGLKPWYVRVMRTFSFGPFGGGVITLPGLVALLTPFWSFYCVISLMNGDVMAALNEAGRKVDEAMQASVGGMLGGLQGIL